MAPSTPGRIDKIYVEEGDRVNKGRGTFPDGPHTALPAESPAEQSCKRTFHGSILF